MGSGGKGIAMASFKKIVLIAYGFLWFWTALDPVSAKDWWFENILIFVVLSVLFLFRKKTHFSNTHFGLIFLFLSLHTVGAYYTYSEVPFGFFLQDVFGSTRNMYDRMVHFMYGFLLVVPVWGLCARAIVHKKSFFSYYIPVEIILATSALYELMEWFAAKTLDPEAGLTFVGAQGDIWDAQKDMWLALLGACLMMVLAFVVRQFKKRQI